MGDGEVKFSNLNAVMKGILVLLSIVGIVVPATLGFVNLDSRIDTQEKVTTSHIVKDDRKWEVINGDVKEIRERLHANELQMATSEAHYQEIMRLLKTMETQLNNLTRVD